MAGGVFIYRIIHHMVDIALVLLHLMYFVVSYGG